MDVLAPASSSAAPRAPARKAWRRPLGWVLGTGLVLGLAAAWALRPAPPPLPFIGTLPAFRFTNQDGRPFGSAELRGKVYVAGFIFTRCPTVCPMMTERMGKLQARLAPLGDRAGLVSFSVDPTYDTPERLLAYGRRHHADPRRWNFLTGDVTPMKDTVVSSFHVALTHEGAEDDFLSIVHGTHFVLVDGHGRIRGYYESADPEAVERLVRDVGTTVQRAE